MSALAEKITVPTPGERYRTVWAEFLAAVTGFERALEKTVDLEKAFFGEREFPLISPHRILRHVDLKDRADDIIGTLAHLAEERFAPPHGARLHIDTREYCRRFIEPITNTDGDADPDWSKFDPAAVWSSLVNDFGGNQSEDVAFRELVGRMCDTLRVVPGLPLAFKGGKLVLHQNIYLNHTYGDTLEYHTHQAFVRLCLDLAVFVRWATEEDEDGDGWRVAQQLNCLARDFGYHDPVESRKHHVFGDGSVILITFKSRFEWRFSRSLSEKLQLFISSYWNAI